MKLLEFREFQNYYAEQKDINKVKKSLKNEYDKYLSDLKPSELAWFLEITMISALEDANANSNELELARKGFKNISEVPKIFEDKLELRKIKEEQADEFGYKKLSKIAKWDMIAIFVGTMDYLKEIGIKVDKEFDELIASLDA